jgi:uncharacterized protein (DUF1015 family)
MSTIKPFKAHRPPADKAHYVACVPYDVIYDSEVRELIAENSLSFLRVTRPEGEYSEADTPSHKAVFERAKQNLKEFIRSGVLVQDKEDAIYVYRLKDGDKSQTGVVACCSIAEYDAGLIKKHEKTRPDKVADRTEHMLTVGAQTGLIFLAFRNTDDIRDLIEDAVTGEPLYHFSCPQNVEQTVWRMKYTDVWVDAFAELPALYVADGHHRAESAKLARDKMREANPNHTGGEEYNFVIAGMFPSEDLNILPYNRVVKDLNGLSKEEFFDKIRDYFLLVDSIDETPDQRGEMSMYFEGAWYKLRFKPDKPVKFDAITGLDVSILQNYLLAPVLGIGDPRTDTRISFVGGARGTAELKKMVDAGEAKVAFSMFPTTMDDLFAVSDMGEIMPPKSTWFEPKLKDGLLIHLI